MVALEAEVASIQGKESLTLAISSSKYAQLRVVLAKLADYILNFIELDLGIPGEATEANQELYIALNVNLRGFDDQFL